MVLSVISTPIGNRSDITLRAMETLRACDAIICEDTRVTGKLLQMLELPKKQLLSMHSYTSSTRIDDLAQRLRNGQHLALVSDAGTPGISDPGYAIVSRAREAGIPVQAIPGPAAFLAALSISGLPINRFLYLGFLPLKKGRQTLLQSLAEEEKTVVLYESVHRIERTLQELATALAAQPERPIVIARELTKLHEEVLSTTVSALETMGKSIVKKGEFVVILGPKPRTKTERNHV